MYAHSTSTQTRKGHKKRKPRKRKAPAHAAAAAAAAAYTPPPPEEVVEAPGATEALEEESLGEGSELDLSDDEPDTDNLVLCKYETITRVKNKVRPPTRSTH